MHAVSYFSSSIVSVSQNKCLIKLNKGRVVFHEQRKDAHFLIFDGFSSFINKPFSYHGVITGRICDKLIYNHVIQSVQLHADLRSQVNNEKGGDKQS